MIIQANSVRAFTDHSFYFIYFSMSSESEGSVQSNASHCEREDSENIFPAGCDDPNCDPYRSG